ncbi:hypothetical protein MMC08_006533, partial [Hypocenomyce scalaris]|nr:hypothetical protein [Hypocenomyce scalaris]
EQLHHLHHRRRPASQRNLRRFVLRAYGKTSRSLSLVQKGGSWAWPLNAEPSSLTREAKEALEEDFQHLLDRSAFLWEQRRKWAKVRQRVKDARTGALTN